MGDDLVKRLREVKDWWREPGRTAEQAADRIEQLEREKASWKGAYDGAVLALTERNKELEAALEKIASCQSHHPDDVVAVARAALGEKKDG